MGSAVLSVFFSWLAFESHAPAMAFTEVALCELVCLLSYECSARAHTCSFA